MPSLEMLIRGAHLIGPRRPTKGAAPAPAQSYRPPKPLAPAKQPQRRAQQAPASHSFAHLLTAATARNAVAPPAREQAADAESVALDCIRAAGLKPRPSAVWQSAEPGQNASPRQLARACLRAAGLWKE